MLILDQFGESSISTVVAQTDGSRGSTIRRLENKLVSKPLTSVVSPHCCFASGLMHVRSNLRRVRAWMWYEMCCSKLTVMGQFLDGCSYDDILLVIEEITSVSLTGGLSGC